MDSTRRTLVSLLCASALTAGTAAAQPAPFNEIGVTMGHWHIVSKDVEANKKLFLAMGGKLFMPGGNPLVMFPGVYVNLVLNDEKGDGGTEGSVVNHVGFIVDNVQQRVAQWKAAGVTVLPGNNGRLDQAFVVTPDGVRMEILEDKAQGVPIRHEHVHLSRDRRPKFPRRRRGTRRPSAAKPARGTTTRSWTCRASRSGSPGRTRSRRRRAGACSITSASTSGITPPFVKKLEADGIKLDEPVRKSAGGNTITYITDPWGTRVEIVQRAPLGTAGAVGRAYCIDRRCASAQLADISK